MQWTPDSVLALAPDSSSIKAAKKLLNMSKWSNIGASERAIWGECQGSGKKPYLTRIDLEDGPAFKCSCPSRKFPCKHGLALFLLRLEHPSSFNNSDAPDWVSEWLEDRTKRAQTQTKKAETKAKQEADPAAAAKRAEQRAAKVQAGLQELELWLHDLLRQGLANIQGRPYSFWDEIASRLVDAQASGLANRLRALGSLAAYGDRSLAYNNTDALLERLGQLHLLLEGYKRLDTLNPDLQADVKSLIGWTQDQKEVLKQDGVTDRWQVLGQMTSYESNLRTQRSWLRGEQSGEWGLVLEFSFGGKPFEYNLVPNTVFEGELVFFAGNAPKRALIKERQAVVALSELNAQDDILSATEGYANALACQPWLERYPMLLARVQPVPDPERWYVTDSTHRLPLVSRSKRIWSLLALSGGHAIDLFGEWSGRSLVPLAASVNGETLRLDV
ncbi:MAG: SWIM zinc finger family protein [Deinococcota bacterium]